MLTPFGKALRKLRIERGVRLLDLGAKVEKSASFISAVETGRKAIPDGFVRQLAVALDLSAAEIRVLRAGADQTRKEVRVDRLQAEDRELVAAFARQLNEAPDELRARFRELVLKSVDYDGPFERKRRGMVVPPLSFARIKDFSITIRDTFCNTKEHRFPIMDVLEFRLHQLIKGYYLDVRSTAEMGSLEGMVVAGHGGLILREDVYSGAWEGVGRHRFTASHEFGHFLMHRSVGMARIRDDSAKIYEDSEWQADSFAGCLLFAERHIDDFAGPHEAAEACGISGAAARVMWGRYRR